MKPSYVVLALLLTILSVSLHIKTHFSAESYLSLLKDQQKSITNLFSTLKSQSSQTRSKVDSESNILNKIKILEQSILRQKSQLHTLSRSTIIPLNDSSWTCKNYQKTSKQQLTGLIDNTISSVNEIDKTINSITNNSNTKYFSPSSTSAVTSAQQIKKMINSNGNSNTQISTGSETNWLADGWVTGNKTLSQAQNIIKQTQQSTGYIQTCPLKTPYFDGNSCISCSSPTPYFSIQTKKCINCEIFNINDRSCKSKTTPPPVPVNYNNTNFQKGLSRIIFPPNTQVQKMKAQSSVPCPQATPFFGKNGCIDCVSPNPLFDYSLKTCTACPEKYTYVPDKYSCVASAEVKVTNLPVAQKRLILPQGETISNLQKQQQQQSLKQNVVVCPSDKPFYNSKQCINCLDNQYFNIKSLNCQSCPQKTTFDPVNHKCVQKVYFSNLLNSSWISTNPSKIYQDAKNIKNMTGYQICPAQKPFYNKVSCIACSTGQYYNFDSSTCQSCPSGTVFNINQHSCAQSQQGLYQTNPLSQNIIYAGFAKNKWISDYQKNKQDFPTIQDCPKDRPYFSINRCINCPSALPYFNLYTKVCENCEEGVSKYDPVVHDCLSSKQGEIITQNPNIQKMMASIFTT